MSHITTDSDLSDSESQITTDSDLSDSESHITKKITMKDIMQIDFNKYLDQNINEVKKNLKTLLHNTCYKIKNCSNREPQCRQGYEINLYGIDDILVKIEHNYYSKHNQFNIQQQFFNSNKYILFKDIANENKIYGVNCTHLLVLLNMEHVKECFGDLLNSKIDLLKTYTDSKNYTSVEDITKNDIITKKIFTNDEYIKLIDYMKLIIKKDDELNKKQKVEVSELDLTKYIGQNIDVVVFKLSRKLLDKYKIYDCRKLYFAVLYAYNIKVICNTKNIVKKIKYEYRDNCCFEVNERGYFEKFKPSYKSLNVFFGNNINLSFDNIIDTIDNKYNICDCRQGECLFFGYGHGYPSIVVFCDSKNIIKLFKCYESQKITFIRPLFNPCHNKTPSDILLDTYLGKHINDVYLELTELLDEKYMVANCRIKNFCKSEHIIMLYCDEDSIVKVIMYKNNDKIEYFKINRSNLDITEVDLNQFIDQKYLYSTTKLLQLLDDKYIINPKDKNEKYGVWINKLIKSENKDTSKIDYYANKTDLIVDDIDYDSDDENKSIEAPIKVVNTIEYFDNDNNKITIGTDKLNKNVSKY